MKGVWGNDRQSIQDQRYVWISNFESDVSKKSESTKKVKNVLQVNIDLFENYLKSKKTNGVGWANSPDINMLLAGTVEARHDWPSSTGMIMLSVSLNDRKIE